MDAAQRLLKNSAILAATALLMATIGLAQPTLNVATNVTMAGTGGQDVTVTSSGSPTTEISYSIGAPSYAADGGGSWLGVTGGTTTFCAALCDCSAHASTLPLPHFFARFSVRSLAYCVNNSSSFPMRPNRPLSHTLCRLEGRPKKSSLTSLPPLSLLSEQCSGWCMSPTKCTRNIRASLRCTAVAAGSVTTFWNSSILAITQSPLGQSRAMSRGGLSIGISM